MANSIAPDTTAATVDTVVSNGDDSIEIADVADAVRTPTAGTTAAASPSTAHVRRRTVTPE